MTRGNWALVAALAAICALSISSWEAHRQLDELLAVIDAGGLDVRDVEQRLRDVEDALQETGRPQVDADAERLMALEERLFALEAGHQVRPRLLLAP